jgi:hypothetical protein
MRSSGRWGLSHEQRQEGHQDHDGPDHGSLEVRHSGEVLKDPCLFDFLGLGDASVGPVMQSKNRQRDPNHSGRAEEPLTRSLGLKLT